MEAKGRVVCKTKSGACSFSFPMSTNLKWYSLVYIQKKLEIEVERAEHVVLYRAQFSKWVFGVPCHLTRTV
jgi:hypothetical protein